MDWDEFTWTFSVSDLNLCGGDRPANASWQQVTSPYYPSQYPDNTECLWAISDSSSDDMIVTIKVCLNWCIQWWRLQVSVVLSFLSVWWFWSWISIHLCPNTGWLSEYWCLIWCFLEHLSIHPNDITATHDAQVQLRCFQPCTQRIQCIIHCWYKHFHPSQDEIWQN